MKKYVYTIKDLFDAHRTLTMQADTQEEALTEAKRTGFKYPTVHRRQRTTTTNPFEDVDAILLTDVVDEWVHPMLLKRVA